MGKLRNNWGYKEEERANYQAKQGKVSPVLAPPTDDGNHLEVGNSVRWNKMFQFHSHSPIKDHI